MMSDLECQNVAAKELLSTLEKIKAAWEALPSEDEVNDLAKAVGDMAGCLERAAERWDTLPFDEDQLNDLAKAAGNVADSLRNAE